MWPQDVSAGRTHLPSGCPVGSRRQSHRCLAWCIGAQAGWEQAWFLTRVHSVCSQQGNLPQRFGDQHLVQGVGEFHARRARLTWVLDSERAENEMCTKDSWDRRRIVWTQTFLRQKNSKCIKKNGKQSHPLGCKWNYIHGKRVGSSILDWNYSYKSKFTVFSVHPTYAPHTHLRFLIPANWNTWEQQGASLMLYFCF